MKKQTIRRALLSGVALSFIATCTEPGSARAQSSGEAVTLDPIVITATKRAQTEDTLPIATKVLTPEDIPDETLDPATEISRQVPGMNFINFGRFGESYMTMRGIATLGSALNTLDNTVGFSVDGIPSSLSALNAPLLDVERIEVLKGPQGTTFGRNALAGSVNVVSRPADGERQYKLDAGVGTDGYRFSQGTVGGWIVPDKVAGRGVLRFENFDGDIPNTVIGGDDGGAKVGAGRGTLRFTPDDTLTIDTTGSFSHNENSDPSNILLEAANFPTSGADTHPLNEQDIASGSLTINKDLASVRLTSVTGYQNTRIKSDADYTDSLLFGAVFGVPTSYFTDPSSDIINTREREAAFNQEFRLSSLSEEGLQWVVGTSYFYSDYTLQRDMQTTYWPTLNGSIDNDIDSQTVALFGDVTVPVAKGWDVSGGLRLAHDHQELDADYVSNGYSGTVASFSQNDSFSDTYLTGRVALSHTWSEDTMAYVSAARGYSSGGFEKSTQYAAYGVATVPFEPAQSWTYEIGMKTRLTPKLRVDGAVFYNDVTDGQLSAFDTSTLAVYFANQDYRSYGVEGNFAADLAESLDLHGGFSAIQSELVNVSAASAAAGAVDGNEVPQVPSFAATLGLDYRFNLESLDVPGMFVLSPSYQFVGTRYADISNSGELDPYQIVNLRLGWKQNGVSIYAFANNLLDERPVEYAVPVGTGASAAYVGSGRLIGVAMSLEW